MIKYIIVFFCAISVTGIAQDKTVSREEMSQKLINCQNSIAAIDYKISQIKMRMTTLPSDSTQSLEQQYFLNERIEQLEEEKISLERVQYSIQDFLKLPSELDKSPIIISKSEFEKYPVENQQQILAHPEKYTVEQN